MESCSPKLETSAVALFGEFSVFLQPQKFINYNIKNAARFYI